MLDIKKNNERSPQFCSHSFCKLVSQTCNDQTSHYKDYLSNFLIDNWLYHICVLKNDTAWLDVATEHLVFFLTFAIQILQVRNIALINNVELSFVVWHPAQYFAHMETSWLKISVHRSAISLIWKLHQWRRFRTFARHLHPLNKEESLSWYNCCDTRP